MKDHRLRQNICTLKWILQNELSKFSSKNRFSILRNIEILFYVDFWKKSTPTDKLFHLYNDFEKYQNFQNHLLLHEKPNVINLKIKKNNLVRDLQFE